MKNMKKLIPALAMLVLSAVMMSTASFAWFSMNTQVEVNGITVDTVAPVYVSIKKTSEGTWNTAVTANKNIKLIPADTNTAVLDNTNGFTWVAIDPNKFQTTTGGGVVAGEKKISTDDLLAISNTGTITTSGWTETAAYLFDSYDFALQNDPGKKVEIYLNQMILDNISKGMVGCLRVALVNVVTTDSTTTRSLVGVYAAGATDTYAPLKEGADGYTADTSTVSTVSGTVGTDGAANTVTYAHAEANAVELPVAANGQVTIEVYVWFEGQDTDCVNANANGGFSITFIFNSKESAVSGT